MVTHKRFQQYKRHYCSSLVTGLLGCRWHRYQQSKNDTGKVDLVWYSVFILILALISVALYYWIIAENNYEDLSWYLYITSGKWWPIYTIALALTCVAFTYMAFLFILTMFHLGLGYQLYIHWLHKVLFVLVLCGGVTVWVVTTDLWMEGWSLQYTSFMITGPFLHIACVIVMTFLTWFIAAGWLTLERKLTRALWMSLYILVMLLLYILPLFIHSPCVCEAEDLPTNPSLVAHRGAAVIAPENTVAAFELAVEYEHVWGFETDVSISYDGVPFVMHDDKLLRTTDVREKFPELADQCGCMFTFSELTELSAGKWFFEMDPHGTAKNVSPTDKLTYENQTVATFREVLDIAKQHDKKVIFDLTTYEYGMPRDHPFYYNYTEVVLQTVVNHGIPQQNVYWLYGHLNVSTAHNLTDMYGKYNNTREMLTMTDVPINIAFQAASQSNVRVFESHNVSVNVWTVNTAWLYSIFWCMGVTSVTSSYVHTLSTLKKPVWHLTPREFRIIWILTDVISLILVVLIFIVQRLRKGVPKKFTPEVVTLNNAKRKITGQAPHSRYMKEKLILAGEGLQEMELEQGIVGISDVDQPDTDSMRYSYSSSMNGDYAHMNPLEGISVQRLSGISGISNVSGLPSTSSDNVSLPGSLNRMLVSEKSRSNDYGTIEDTEQKKEDVNMADIQVEVS